MTSNGGPPFDHLGDFLPVIQPGSIGGPQPEGVRTNVLPLAHLHLRAGWHPAPVHFFTLPLWYAGTYDEQQIARERAVIMDRSHVGRFYVTGERAIEVLDRVFASDPSRVPVGGIRRAVACRDDGTMLDIAHLAHLDEGRWLVVTGPRAQQTLLEAVESAIAPGEDVVVRDRLTESVLLSVQGPAAAQLLEGVVGQTIPGAVPLNEAHEILLGGYRALVAHVSDFGEDGYWFIVSPEVGEHFWESALTLDITPAGLAAYDAMRMEAGLIEAPTETPAPATPFHAGLGDLVHLDGANGPRAFTGREALGNVSHHAERGELERTLQGVQLEGRRLAKRGSRISMAARDLGACVNATFSPVLNAGIALAYLPPGLERVVVDTDGVPEEAAVVPLPFIEGPRGAVG